MTERRAEALATWNANRKAQQRYAEKTGHLTRADLYDGNREAFVRLYVLTRWEDLSLVLAPLLTDQRDDPDSMTDPEAEAFIDSHVQVLAKSELIGDGAKDLLRQHGWRTVAAVVQQTKR